MRRSVIGTKAARNARPTSRVKAKSASQSPLQRSSKKMPPTPRGSFQWRIRKYSSAQALNRG